MSNYINLAQRIVNTNDQSAYIQMVAAICDPIQIQMILNQIHLSDVLHFTFTQILTKSILNQQFCPINQTKSDDNCMKQNMNQKAKLYSIIIPTIFNNISYMNFDKKQYILRSALNSISACLKDLCDNSRNITIFTNILQSTLFPYFKINEIFVNSMNNDIVIIQPNVNIINYLMTNVKALQLYKYSAKIMIQLIQYITMVTVYKTYYQYRRNIYTFRNTFLASILNVAVQYYKIIYFQWQKNQSSQQLFNCLSISITLLQKLITYPFSLTLHQFQSDEQSKDNIVGLSSQIYFPTFYRNLLCDEQFLNIVFELFMFIRSQINEITQLRDTVYSMIRVIGRIISASIYTFNTDNQRKQFRSYCANITITLLYNFKFYDSFYLDSLSDIFSKVLTSYTTMDLGEKKQKILEALLFYSEEIIKNSIIKLEDGKRNPFNRVFDLLVTAIAQSKQTLYEDKVKIKSEEILNLAFIRLYDWQNCQNIMKQYGKNKKSQIQCFQELFSHIPLIFALNLQSNLQKLKTLQIQNFTQSQQTIWLHLCALLLPNHNATFQQTSIILKYFKVAKNGHSIGSLHFIQTLVSQILYQMDNGAPNNNLWSWIHEIQKCTFTQFMLYVIKVCKSNFQASNTDILDYSLEVFKQIYVKLRKNNNQKFQQFYQQVKSLINNLNSTVFQNPKHFKRRVELFSVISSIWINNQNIKYIYEIYNLISNNIKKEYNMGNISNINNINPTCFIKYMHDLSGILQPIDSSDSFQVVVQLAIQDLKIILPLILSSQNISNLFSQQPFLKSFCKMVLQFVTDYCRRLTYNVQNDIQFQIYDLFKPYLLQVIKYEYPKCVITIWQKFIVLNPIEQMLPLSNQMKNKQSKDYHTLIRQYFQNIHRVPLEMLQSLYPYIEDRIEYLVYWWEEVIRRKLYPKISLLQVVQSRIATTKRQKEELARLIYFVGSYSESYWNLQGFTQERQFIKWFMDNYKDFKDSIN